MEKVKYQVRTCCGDLVDHVEVDANEDEWKEQQAAEEAAVEAGWNLRGRCGSCYDNLYRVNKVE